MNVLHSIYGELLGAASELTEKTNGTNFEDPFL